MKFKKLSLSLITCFTTLSLLAACNTTRTKTVQDCSGMFETRDSSGTKISKKKTVEYTDEDVDSNVITECKVLEVKIDRNTKCEIVGSDKLDALTESLEKNSRNRTILITPKDNVKEIAKLANKHLKEYGVSIDKYLNSDVMKNIDYPYKGMRCVVDGKEFTAWSGGKNIILTMGKK